MKKNSTIIALLLAISMLAGCVQQSQQPVDNCASLEKANQQLESNLKMYESTWDKIINGGDLEQINETNFDRDVVLVTSPDRIVGIEGFKDYYKNYLSAFSNVRFTIKAVFGQGDNIVKHWNFKGKHTGDFFGLPATDKEVDMDGITLVKMKNGKIAQEQDFVDDLEFMQQLGMLPR